jgi:hypothetical protein
MAFWILACIGRMEQSALDQLCSIRLKYTMVKAAYGTEFLFLFALKERFIYSSLLHSRDD